MISDKFDKIVHGLINVNGLMVLHGLINVIKSVNVATYVCVNYEHKNQSIATIATDIKKRSSSYLVTQIAINFNTYIIINCLNS